MISWFSVDENLEKKFEEEIVSFEDAEKVLFQYKTKWDHLREYVSSERYEKGDGTDILTQTLFSFHSDTQNFDLEVNMEESYQVTLQVPLFKYPFLSWMKTEKKKDTSDFEEVKEIVRKFLNPDFKKDDF